MAAVAVKYPAFQELQTEVLAISVDSVETHRRWQQEELSRMVTGGIAFPMLSDPEGKIGTLFGVFDPIAKRNLRGRFLIDPRRVLQSIEVLGEAIGRSIPEALRQLKALQHFEKTGERLPSGWQPGKPSLPKEKEPERLAGKIWEIWNPRNAF